MTLLRADLLRDLLFLWHPAERVLHTCMSVGMDVCGHPSIVHGGFTSGACMRRPGLVWRADAAWCAWLGMQMGSDRQHCRLGRPAAAVACTPGWVDSQQPPLRLPPACSND